MLRSLVGSEMCIRDRHYEDRAAYVGFEVGIPFRRAGKPACNFLSTSALKSILKTSSHKNASNLPLLLFAKEPVAGKVKTRLVPHCTFEQASKIAEILIEQTILMALDYWPGKIILSAWGDVNNDQPFIEKMATKYSLELHQQCAGDLGQKMWQACNSFNSPVAILGCDAPRVKSQAMSHVYSVLMNGGNAIIPTEDGGYCLIALGEAKYELFQGIEWGSAKVFDQTLRAIDGLDLAFDILPQSYDIDRWHDIKRAANKIDALDKYLRAEGLKG